MFIDRSRPGTAIVYPTIPCSPGVRPVPSELTLTAVVDGNPVVSGSAPSTCETRKGAAARWRRSISQPSPSTSSRQTRDSEPGTSEHADPGTPSAPSSDGTRSASDACPYRGGGGADGEGGPSILQVSGIGSRGAQSRARTGR
jgi:hypothetical protein